MMADISIGYSSYHQHIQASDSIRKCKIHIFTAHYPCFGFSGLRAQFLLMCSWQWVQRYCFEGLGIAYDIIAA
jgi:hypothetical protein